MLAFLFCTDAQLREVGISMRITFDNQTRATLEHAKESYSTFTKAAENTAAFSGYQISSSLNTPTTYETGKNVADIASAADAKSLTMDTDRLVIMAHNMSPEEYAKYCENGELSEMDPKDAVTMLDHIKADLVKGGAQIEGFTDDIPEELKKEIGRAAEKAAELTEMTEGMKKSFVTSGKDMTIDNLYLAKFSDAGNANKGNATYFAIEAPGYLAQKAAPVDEATLREQVTKLLSSEGNIPTEEEIDAGIWLVNNSLCINEENISRYLEVNALSLPVSDEQLEKAINIAVFEGKRPVDADLSRTESIYEEAVRITDEILKMDDAEVHATRVLEEARLKMTTEANILLIKSGFSIDTKDLEAYVEALRNIEKTPEYIESKEIADVKEAVSEIKTLPAALIGKMISIPDADLTAVRNEGNRIKESFESAMIKYEQVSTEVRKDLGDSIKKAFANVDDILRETGLEPNESNRRAVRILGYNSMSITKESISEVEEFDAKLNHVLKELTPKDTMDLIRKGSSPIKMSISELDEFLTNKEKSDEQQMEKYSKFLYKLERSENIDKEERDRFIEVYRLLHQLEKTDYAAIGGLIKTGRELTFANLREEIKTAKHTGTDIKIDETFGFLVDSLEREIEPERLKAISFSDTATLNETYDSLVSAPKDEVLEAEYSREKFEQFSRGLEASEDSMIELLSNSEPVTVSKLLETEILLHGRGRAFKKVLDIRKDDFEEEIDELKNNFDGKEEAGTKYEEMMENSKKAVYEAAMESDRYLDVKELTLTHKQLSLAVSFSKEETYNVPMEIDGEMTDVVVKLVHNEKEEPCVAVSFTGQYIGKVTARFTVDGGKTSGYIACNYEDTVTELQKTVDILGENISVIYSKDTDRDFAFSRLPMKDNSEKVSSYELYRVAKKFLKNIGEMYK